MQQLAIADSVHLEEYATEMTAVESLFLKFSTPVSSQELCDGLAGIVQTESHGGSPAPVKCTKKLYNSLIKHMDAMISQELYDNFCVILNALRYIVKGSPSMTNGFTRLLSFGLPKKISAWCADVCLVEHQKNNKEGWRKAADDMLFTLTVLMTFSEEAKRSMIPFLPKLLQCISCDNLPGSARIEATRSSNCLLEVCGSKYKGDLTAQKDIKALIWKMENLIQRAGDFELQVTILECFFRLTTTKERELLAKQWFRGYSSLLTAFNSIRESFFEVDCRKFLNLLNANCGENRSVYSFPCIRAYLGSFELHQPYDEGLQHFWVDFNIATSNLSLYTEDLNSPEGGGSGGGEEDDGMWESIIIKNNIVKEWSIKAINNELLLSIILNVPANNLLPSMPSSSSHKVTITFQTDSDPTFPLQSIFGSIKQVHYPNQASIAPSCAEKSVPKQNGADYTPKPIKNTQSLELKQRVPSQAIQSSQTRGMKQSISIAPLRITHKQFKPQGLQDEDIISPIEILPNTPAVGGHVNSEDSATPINHTAPPMATPATSTPKVKYDAPLSSSGVRRLPLEFISGSGGTSRGATRPKASQAVSSVVLGMNSRIVQTKAPPARKLFKPVSKNPTHDTEATKPTKKIHSIACTEATKPATKVHSVAVSDSVDMSNREKESADGNIKETVKNKTASLSKKGNCVSKKEISSIRSASGASEDERLGMERIGCGQEKTQRSHQSSKQQKTKTRTNLNSQKCTTANQQHQVPVKSTEAPTRINNTSSVSAKRTTGPPQSPIIGYSRVTDNDNPKRKKEKKNTSPGPQTALVSDKHVSRKTSLKTSSPPLASKHLNSSNAFMFESYKPRVPLNDVSNACLKRGGQKRVFNLSSVPKQRRKIATKHKKSNSSSLNSSAASEYQAIPDSIPLDTTQKSNASGSSQTGMMANSASTGKRRYKRTCIPVRDDSNSPGSSLDDPDSSWEISPPKEKKSKKVSKSLSSENDKSKTATTKPVLASARTKKRPRVKGGVHISSFELTDSDLEQDSGVTETKKPKKGIAAGKRKRTSGEPVTEFDDLKKSTTALSAVLNKGTGEKNNRNTNTEIATLPPAKSHAKKSRSIYGSKRRVIDDMYDPLPALSPEVSKTEIISHNTKSPSVDEDVGMRNEPPKSKRRRKEPEVKEKEDNILAKTTRRSPQTKSLHKPARKNTLRALLREDEKEKDRNSGGKQMESERESDCESDCDQWSGKPMELDCDEPKEVSFKSTTKQNSITRLQLGQLKQSRRSSGYHSKNNSVSESSPFANDGIIDTGATLDIYRGALQDKEDQVSNLSTPPAFTTPLTPLSVASSEVEADLDITTRFEKICHSLVAKSGKEDTAVVTTTHIPAKVMTKKKSVNAENKSQGNLESSTGNITLTQLSRDIINSHKPVKHKKNETLGSVRGHPTKAIESDPAGLDEDLNSSKLSDAEDSVSLISFGNATLSPGHESPSLGKASKRLDYFSEESQSTTSEELKLSTEMKTLMTTVRNNLYSAKKKKKKVSSSSLSKKVPEELEDLWFDHQQERCSLLKAYEHQLTLELEQLERDMQRTLASEEQVTTTLRQQISNLSKKRKYQQSQLSRVQALLQSFHEQLSNVESSHAEQQYSSQKAIKEDLFNLQKRLLAESQKQECERIRRSLHAVLMHI